MPQQSPHRNVCARRTTSRGNRALSHIMGLRPYQKGGTEYYYESERPCSPAASCDSSTIIEQVGGCSEQDPLQALANVAASAYANEQGFAQGHLYTRDSRYPAREQCSSHRAPQADCGACSGRWPDSGSPMVQNNGRITTRVCFRCAGTRVLTFRVSGS